MKRLLFKGKASAVTILLKKISVEYKGLTVADYASNLARERRAKAALAGNIQQTSRAATL